MERGSRAVLVGLFAAASLGLFGVPVGVSSAAAALPVVGVGDVVAVEGDGGSVMAVFPVRLSVLSGSAVSFTLVTADGSAVSSSPADFTALSTRTVTIPAGRSGTNVTVTVRGDGIPEPDETFTVQLSSPSGAVLGRATGTGTILDDDLAAAPTVAIGDVRIPEGNTANAKATLDVTLDLPAANPVVLPWSVVPGTAAAGADYVSGSGSLTFPAGTTSRTVTVTIKGDTTIEADETFAVVLGSASGVTVDDGSGLVTISDDDPPAGTALRIGDAVVYEGDTRNHVATFPVRLTRPLTAPIGVSYTTVAGTAMNDDFIAKTGTLTIPAGAVAASVTVTVSADALDDAALEQFSVQVTGAGGTTIADPVGTGAIIDDDSPAAVVSIGEGAAVEGNGGTASVRIPITLRQPQPIPVSVKVTSSNGTAGAGDFAAVVDRTVTIPAGVTSAWVPVTLKSDTVGEGPEAFGLALSAAVGASIGRAGAMYTILDDEPVLRTLAVTNTGTGAGIVLSNPAGINCGVTCTAEYPEGATITLTSTPASDSYFAGWTGGSCSGSGPCTLTITADTAIEASFVEGSGVVQITAGGAHTCVLFDTGSVKCWGGNEDGELGLGDAVSRGDDPGEMGTNLVAVDLGPGRGATQLAAGTAHTCALLNDGAVKCWGWNATGQLGLGDKARRGRDPGEMGPHLAAVDLGPGRTARQIAAGSGFTCALLDNASVKCWGYNGQGQLGLGDTRERGDGPGEMGANLPAVALGAGRNAKQIAAGMDHACAVLDIGLLKCWGGNGRGQLGLGDTSNRGDEPEEMGSDLPAVDVGPDRTVRQVALGWGRTCAVLDNDTVKCWGTGGQLGLGDSADRGANPAEMGANLPSVDLGEGRRVLSIALGAGHACALLGEGAVKCWGSNDVGQLGLGDVAQRGDQSSEMGVNLPPVDLGSGQPARILAAGRYWTCALLGGNALKCWGFNLYGQLGYGDRDNRGDQPSEMGDNLPTVDLGVS